MMTKMEYQPVRIDRSTRAKRNTLRRKIAGIMIAITGNPDQGNR